MTVWNNFINYVINTFCDMTLNTKNVGVSFICRVSAKIKMGKNKTVCISILDEKLKSLEELYSSKREDLSHSSRTAVEERILTYQRQLEDRYNSQLKLEVCNCIPVF